MRIGGTLEGRLEAGSKAQAGDRAEGSWKVGSRRESEADWRAKLEGWQPVQAGG